MDVVFAATDGLKAQLSVLLNSTFNGSCQRRCSMSDKEKSSKRADPQKRTDGRRTEGIHGRQPRTESETRGNLPVYLNFSSCLKSELFPVIRL